MKIVIEEQRYASMRYPTVGDWELTEPELLQISVAHELPDWRYKVLVGIHEAIEAILCKQRGITDDAVTAFDKAYEAEREAGDDSEPGDDPTAPYFHEHGFATQVERMLAKELGVDWDAYDAAVNAL